MTRLTGGQALARALRAEGVELVFGIVGTHNVHIVDGLYDVPGLRFVTVRHEQGAGFMADGYARASGRVAACLVVPGPGLTNLMTPLGQAYLDSVPILAVTGQNPVDRLDRRLEDFHELRGSLSVAGAVTASATRATSPSEVPAAVRSALRLMRSQRPRPTLIELPMDVAAAQAEVEELVPSEEPARQRGDAAAVARAADWLAQARRPLILAGGGVISADAAPLVRLLAERLGAPVVATCHGLGALPADHPLSLGDGWSRLRYLDRLLAEADLCLALGTSFESVSDAERGARLPSRLVQVDLDPTAIGRHRPAELGIVGDVGAVLEQLLRLVPADAPRTPWADLDAVRAAKQEALRRQAGPVMGILAALRRALPRDAMVADDLCLPGYWAFMGFDVYEPRTLFHPGMYGTLGYALPAAIGAQIGRPDRPAVALCGDGGFLYTVQELATAVRERVDVTAIVFNDNGYGALRQYQDRHFAGRRVGVELTNPDFARLAEAFGARGVRLGSHTELGPAVADALGRGGPTVIECPLDFDLSKALPPWLA
jgi:acetolactate synthase I/II/III large subunit